MAQVFSRRFTLVSKLMLLGAAVALVGVFIVYRLNARADAPRAAPIVQPVPFSHKHHAGDDGIDCRYCHSSVEQSAFAGLPSLQVCMTCHSQLYTRQAVLAPLVKAYSSGGHFAWNRVNDLPDFVYFNHSIHVAKGVGCVTCHGQIDEMPLTARAASLDMQWCLSCHRDPAPNLRPHAHEFDMHWHAKGNRHKLGEQLMAANHIRSPLELTQCSVCHR